MLSKFKSMHTQFSGRVLSNAIGYIGETVRTENIVKNFHNNKVRVLYSVFKCYGLFIYGTDYQFKSTPSCEGLRNNNG